MVVVARLGMSAHVHCDHPRELTDLRGREADAVLERAHRVDEIPGHRLRLARLGRGGHLLQNRVRIDEYVPDGQGLEHVRFDSPDAHLDP
jgi:hypothetical protein